MRYGRRVGATSIYAVTPPGSLRSPPSPFRGGISELAAAAVAAYASGASGEFAISTSTDTATSRPYGLFALMALAAVLYVLMLINALTPMGSGDAAFSDAYEAFLIIVGLWIVLAVMLIVGGLMGSMPHWAGWIAVLLLPLSGVAAFAAIDMCSRNMRGAVVFPAALALIIAFYAYWARATHLQERMPAQRVSGLTWGAVFFLSVFALLAAAA
jgi:hypothetical protein